MKPDAIRTHAPKVLTAAQRDACFETGFLRALVDRHPDFRRFSSKPPLADTGGARGSPVALFVYSSAGAFAWMPVPTTTSHTGDIVRGSPATVAQKAAM